MPIYAYKAWDREGKRVEGDVEAVGPRDAFWKVDRMEYFLTNAKEIEAGGVGLPVARPSGSACGRPLP